MTKPSVFNYQQYLAALDRIEQLENELNGNRAEWARDEGPLYYVYTCSRCGYYIIAPTRFCPGCGARMMRDNLDL